MSQVTVKPLQWTENREPCEECRYNHCIAETPFGRFLVSWKGWKDDISSTLDLETPWGSFHSGFLDVDNAKQRAYDEYSERIKQAIV